MPGVILEKHCGAVAIILLSASIILALTNYLHVPVALAEIVTCSVIGFSCAHAGIKTTAQSRHVHAIYKLWPACPLTTAVTSFSIAWPIKAFLPLSRRFSRLSFRRLLRLAGP